MPKAAPYRKKAKALYPQAEWIEGEGRYALLALCPSMSRPRQRECLTITLHETMVAAVIARAQLDRTGCGSGCCNNHKVVTIPKLRETVPKKKATVP